MSIVFGIFTLSVAYAVLGNIIVYAVLSRRGIPIRIMWAGTPGYLYRLCVSANPPVGAGLKWFSLSTNVAFVVAIILVVALGGFHE